MYGKSIPRAEIEGAFEDVLAALQPNESMVTLAVSMFKTYWNRKRDRTRHAGTVIRADIAKTERDINKLVDRIVQTTNDRVVSALENRIAELEKHKMILAEKAVKNAKPQPTFNEILELSLKFLANPYRLWVTGDFNLRRLVLRLMFTEPLQYRRYEGYRTPKTSLPFSILGEKTGNFLPEMSDGAPGRSLSPL